MSDAPAPGLEQLRLHDTRTRSVRPFAPLDPPRVGIYTCGPTVYAPQHLGNMRSQIVPDLLRRVLVAAGYDVTFVTNITDVGHLVSDADEGDDKVERAAAASGQTAAEITAHFTEQWADDRSRLGCLAPDVLPRAAAHVPEQIAMIRTLEAQGHTYVIDDGVYFDVSTFPRYAEFARLDLDELATSGRVEHIEAKRHPADFALWKRTAPGVVRQQEWDSPWGRGFPGWHIECSAMATRYLGDRFDIHTGGIDHVRVHHTNEVAQSECALGVHPWVGWWVHTEFLDLGGAKMSKSAGDVLLVDSLVERGIDPLAFRYFTFQTHYRQQQAFTFEAVEASGTALRRLVGHAVAARDAGGAGGRRRRRSRRCGGASGRRWPTTSTRRRPSPSSPRWPRTRRSLRRTSGPCWPMPTGPSASAWPTPWRRWPTTPARTPASTPWSPSARPPAPPATSPPPTASATSSPPRASTWSTPPPAPPGAADSGLPPRTSAGHPTSRLAAWVYRRLVVTGR